MKTHGTFYISPAETKDLSVLSALVNSAYRGESSQQGWTTEAEYLDGQRTDPLTLMRELQDPNCAILCLREDSTQDMVGCVLLRFHDDSSVSKCYLGMLTVNPTMQAHGIGKIILEKAEDYARNHGAAAIKLGVIHLRTTLMSWYERRGYVRTGKTQPFPYEDTKAGIPKRDDLYFIMFEKSL